MEFGGVADGGGLELRREDNGGVRLSGRFHYNSPAVLSDGGRKGRPVKEQIAPGAFDYTIDEPDTDIHFLAGHSFDKVLASKKSGTMTFRKTAGALIIAAYITPAILRASYAQDAVAQVEAGLATGLSPGFRLPPERAVPREEAESLEDEEYRPEEGMHRAIIRTIKQAILVEMSTVVRPVYKDATVEAVRSWDKQRSLIVPKRSIQRWRA
ncbi:MAG: HK97 family phage prohead protease [Sinobacteraceae bacterium]|nr:HK97 family phage prohead protease [Nevskiaceae bacterium]